MMRAVALLAFALAACSPAPQSEFDRTALAECGSLTFTGELTPAQCTMQVGEHTLNLNYHPLEAGAVAGIISGEVVGEDGAVIQSILEPDVNQYHAPSVQDIDGDGRADFVMHLDTGNVNSEMALWVFNGGRGVYERVGDASGVSIERTDNGLIAVPARSSASEWEVAFYQLDEGGLHPVAAVAVTAPVGRSTEQGCRLISPPPHPGDDASTVTARTVEYCTKPVVTGVFQ